MRDSIILSTAMALIVSAPLALHWIDSQAETDRLRIAYERNKSHQELIVRKLEAEAKIAELKTVELKLASGYVNKEGIPFERN